MSLRSSTLPGLLLLTLAAPPACHAPAAARRPDRPNVVIVFTDDQGWADLGVQGAQGFATPNLDRMAAEGVRFTDFYVAQPVCSASRAALLTGCYPNRLGIHGALGPDSRVGLHGDELTLAELARSRGYATAIFGKWHLGHQPEFSPLRHGFDEFYGIPYSNDMWPYHPESPEAWGDLPTLEGERVVGLNTDQNRFTEDFTARAVDFVERNAQRPFLLYLAHPMPHVPLHASEAARGRSRNGLYGDVIEELDASLGRLLEVLEREGLERDTLVLFASDNGPWLSYGDHAGSAGPLREGKGTTFEGGVRVPFLARLPGRLPAGRVVDAPAMTIDVFPTVARLIGAELPGHGVDGRDLWPWLAGEPGADPDGPHEALWFYYHRGDLEALRSGRWKLHFPHGYRSMEGRAPGAGGIPGQYDYQRRIELALFDLRADPGETTDLAGERPEVVARLEDLARAARADLGDALTKTEGTGARAPGRPAEPTAEPTAER